MRFINVKQFKKKFVYSFIEPELFYLPIEKSTGEIKYGSLGVSLVTYSTYNYDTKIYSGEMDAHGAIVIRNSNGQIVYNSKSRKYDISTQGTRLPVGNYTVKVIRTTDCKIDTGIYPVRVYAGTYTSLKIKMDWQSIYKSVNYIDANYENEAIIRNSLESPPSLAITKLSSKGLRYVDYYENDNKYHSTYLKTFSGIPLDWEEYTVLYPSATIDNNIFNIEKNYRIESTLGYRYYYSPHNYVRRSSMAMLFGGGDIQEFSLTYQHQKYNNDNIINANDLENYRNIVDNNICYPAVTTTLSGHAVQKIITDKSDYESLNFNNTLVYGGYTPDLSTHYNSAEKKIDYRIYKNGAIESNDSWCYEVNFNLGNLSGTGFSGYGHTRVEDNYQLLNPNLFSNCFINSKNNYESGIFGEYKTGMIIAYCKTPIREYGFGNQYVYLPVVFYTYSETDYYTKIQELENNSNYSSIEYNIYQKKLFPYGIENTIIYKEMLNAKNIKRGIKHTASFGYYVINDVEVYGVVATYVEPDTFPYTITAYERISYTQYSDDYDEY